MVERYFSMAFVARVKAVLFVVVVAALSNVAFGQYAFVQDDDNSGAWDDPTRWLDGASNMTYPNAPDATVLFRISGLNQTAEVVYTKCSGLNPPTGTSSSQWSCRGRNWVHGDYATTRYNHVMPPNGVSCSQTSTGSVNAIPINEDGGATTASSLHSGGVNMACADGSIHFVSDSVDRLVWSALGSRDGEETISDSPF